MGRKKSYDRDKLVAKSMNLFREHGFAGTSTEMLVEELAVNRYSIYAEFGSKQGLFDAALERYEHDVIDQSFGPLEAPDAGLVEIQRLLEFYGAAWDGPAAGKGCLLCNTAVEFGAGDPGGADVVQRYFARLSAAFASALKNAKLVGDLRDEVNPASEAHFLTAWALGIFVMLRAKAPRETVENAANIAINHLETLRKTPSVSKHSDDT